MAPTWGLRCLRREPEKDTNVHRSHKGEGAAHIQTSSAVSLHHYDFREFCVMASGNSPVVWATWQECWNAHREVIMNLYLVQNKTLKEVMEIMKNEFSFKARYA